MTKPDYRSAPLSEEECQSLIDSAKRLCADTSQLRQASQLLISTTQDTMDAHTHQKRTKGTDG